MGGADALNADLMGGRGGVYWKRLDLSLAHSLSLSLCLSKPSNSSIRREEEEEDEEEGEENR